MRHRLNISEWTDKQLFEEFRPWINVYSTAYHNQVIASVAGCHQPRYSHINMPHAGSIILAQLSTRFGLRDEQRQGFYDKIIIEAKRIGLELVEQTAAKGTVSEQSLHQRVVCQPSYSELTR